VTDEDQALDVGYYAALADDDPVELYENAPCAYVSTLEDGTISKVNRTFCAWTGYQPADLVGHRRLIDILTPGARIYYETHLAPSLRMQGFVREIATDVVCTDGSRLPVILNAALQLTGPRAVRIALFDATERRAYEEELRAARQRAEASEARARALAETLQASFLPPDLLEIPGLDIAGAYRPAGDGFEVGGDFYDLFETGRGTWGLVLGDVMGKGAAAATVTALARYTVRSEAPHTPYPSAVLAALHEAIQRTHPDRFCTAVLLLVGLKADRWMLTLAAGGHHLPLRLRDGLVDRIGTEGTILGMLDHVELSDTAVELRSGDVIVLYTDGLTEARRHSTFLGDDAVEAIVLASAGGDASTISEKLVEHAVDYQLGSPRDDIAVVVLRVP
jgi:sigma-B regulation protein RsbU (phosphoserine phosphatase)